MTFRKKTTDNSVQYIAKSEQTQSISREGKPNTIKNNSLPRKQSTNISQNKKFLKNVAAAGFGFLK